MKNQHSFRAASAILFAAVLLTTAPDRSSRAEDAQPFNGNKLTISVGYGAGGGFDLYCRLLGRFIGKHIPGNPTVIVQNVTGAGSLKLANYLYNNAPKDGTAIGMVAQTLPVDQLLGGPGINFDYSKFNIVGRMATTATLLVAWHTVPVKTIEDAEKYQISIAATGPSSEASILPAVLNNLIGTKFKIVRGYRGTSGMMIALERHEVDASTVIVSSLMSQFSRLLRDKSINVLVQNSLKRNSAFPNVPTTIELARDDDTRTLMKLFAVGGEIGRTIIAPPGVSKDVVAMLQKAFMDTMKDPEFIAAAKQSKLDLAPMNGEEMQSIINSISATPKPLLKRALAAKQSD